MILGFCLGLLTYFLVSTFKRPLLSWWLRQQTKIEKTIDQN